MGFSWDSADEAKMQQTFGAGRSLFARFLDLQQVRAGAAACLRGLPAGRLLGCCQRLLPAPAPSWHSTLPCPYSL